MIGLRLLVSLITSRVSGRGNRIGPVFPSVCQFVSALMAKPFDVLAPKLVQGLTLIKSQTSLTVKVIGQGHQVEKRDLRSILLPSPALCDIIHYSRSLYYGTMKSCGITE